MFGIDDILGIGAGLVGGFLNQRAGKEQQQAAAGMSAADRDFAREMYNRQLQDSRANQSSDFGDLTWEQDPVTGKWTQRNIMNPAEAARLGDFRQIAADRMRAAKGISSQFAQGGINYDALGLGKIAGAAGVQGGGNSDAIADARAGKGIVGQPGWSQGQMQGMGMPSGGGGFIGGQRPSPQGSPMPTQGPPGAAGPGARDPYTPAPITPPVPGGPPPPAPSAPPPQAPQADPNAMANFQAMLKSGYSQGMTPEIMQHFGGDSMLKAVQSFDPNAKFSDINVGGGGEGGGAGVMGKRLDFDPRLLSQMLRGG